METIKVSVIVPVYNVERYLEKCLNTLVRQSLKEMEIVVVNDGSPDRSQEIIDRFVRECPGRIAAYQKENGGLSDARNFGIEHARGEYIAFLDSDDWVDLDLYERMLSRAEETGADLVVCPVTSVWEDGRQKPVGHHFPALCEGKALREVFCRFYPVVWNKLYHRSLFEKTGIRFKVGALFEDVEFSHRLLPFVSRAASIEIASVWYLQREGSITARPDSRLFCYLTNFESVYAFFEERGLLPAWERELEYAACRYLLATFVKRAGALSNEEFERAVTESLAFLQAHFPNWRRNPYLWKNGAKGLYLRFFSPRLARWMRRRSV